MGRFVDLNQRLSEEDKAYLRSRGRGYLIPANERRFGTNENPREPEEHEQAGQNAISPFYQPEDREAAVYDKGGAPLPGTVLDYNTGRVADRENGKLVEFTGPGHTPGAFDLQSTRGLEYAEGGFVGYDVDENGNPVDDEIDEDIVAHVLAVSNVTALKKEIKERGGEYDSDAKRQDLENTLAILLQDLRDAGNEPFALPGPDGTSFDSTGAGSDGAYEDEDEEDDETE
ncbi:hypothetical protein SEA_LABELLE_23 [Mycobacterium phage Labelle]|nr:hypothetical protein SEA_LABELLE_23 [Mycobacterium phage Labelle]